MLNCVVNRVPGNEQCAGRKLHYNVARMKHGQENAAESASDKIQIESVQVLVEFHRVVNQPDCRN
jgi:hypothetical protein